MKRDPDVTANQLYLLSCRPFSDTLATTEQGWYFDCFIDSGRERDQSNMSKTINLFISELELQNVCLLINQKAG